MRLHEFATGQASPVGSKKRAKSKAAKRIEELSEEQLDEISRRDFLGALGAAAVYPMVKNYKSDPKFPEPGVYEGKGTHYLGGYSDNSSGDGVGQDAGYRNIQLRITDSELHFYVAVKQMVKGVPEGPMVFKVPIVSRSDQGIVAKTEQSKKSTKGSGYIQDPADPTNRDKLILANPKEVTDTYLTMITVRADGTVKFRKMSYSDYPQQKGWKYHTWGVNGVVKLTGSALKETTQVSEGWFSSTPEEKAIKQLKKDSYSKILGIEIQVVNSKELQHVPVDYDDMVAISDKHLNTIDRISAADMSIAEKARRMTAVVRQYQTDLEEFVQLTMTTDAASHPGLY